MYVLKRYMSQSENPNGNDIIIENKRKGQLLNERNQAKKNKTTENFLEKEMPLNANSDPNQIIIPQITGMLLRTKFAINIDMIILFFW